MENADIVQIEERVNCVFMKKFSTNTHDTGENPWGAAQTGVSDDKHMLSCSYVLRRLIFIKSNALHTGSLYFLLSK